MADPRDIAILVLYLLALRKRSESDTSDSTWQTITATPTVEGLSRPLIEAEAPNGVDRSVPTRVVKLISPALTDSMVVELVSTVNNIQIDDYGDTASVIVDRFFGLGGRGDLSALSTSNSRQSALLINAAATTLESDTTVFDPACGIGGTLLRLYNKQQNLALIGNDIDGVAVTIAQLHAYLAGIPATFTHSDSLTSEIHGELRSQTIITEPPMGMRPDRDVQQNVLARAGFDAAGALTSDELFLYMALSNLTPGGYAYVLTSTAAGFRGASQQIRQELVARGLVEAVIQLPSRLLPYSGIPTLLWVLHRPVGDPETSLLIADASTVSDPQDEIAQWLTDLRAGREIAIPARRLSLAELITNDGSIVPPALLRAELEEDEVREDLKKAMSALSSSVKKLRDLDLDEQIVERVPSSRSFTNLKQLIDTNAITRIRKPFLEGRDNAPKDGIEAFMLSPAKSNRQPKKVKATEADLWIQDGDIVVPLHSMGSAWIFKADGNNWVVSPSIIVLRVNDPDLDPQYLVSCINAPFNEPATKGSAIPRRDFKQIQIPELDHDQQQQLTASLEKLSSLKTGAEDLAQQAAAAEAAVLNAVRFDNRPA
ncbi:N-6 DNA Methylase [Corynebacterium efficiens YS-314]|uniref:Putative type I restriction-modification system methylase n=1 Tax=Corynebacterium efficiens (strain DSM 44549 / YS-314 / AJ 12310 / JCM 11189 / NBRC 100395) TaxID=196164 RepID=Q8FN22_COREF|nr:N-6 DNA methylase [Corynebacterium efficiens]EEW48993.1 N-6 DNA Methylase [Corynebacterium efficiens YS-314]BAC19136.1 putative type I restriction-modification system methylase [Corynebacterium efficiens YS-314]